MKYIVEFSVRDDPFTGTYYFDCVANDVVDALQQWVDAYSEQTNVTLTTVYKEV